MICLPRLGIYRTLKVQNNFSHKALVDDAQEMHSHLFILYG